MIAPVEGQRMAQKAVCGIICRLSHESPSPESPMLNRVVRTHCTKPCRMWIGYPFIGIGLTKWLYHLGMQKSSLEKFINFSKNVLVKYSSHGNVLVYK